MKLETLLPIIQKDPLHFGVKFWDAKGEDYQLMPTTINISRLMKDWYDKAAFCPENDEKIYGIEVFNDVTGQVYFIEDEIDSAIDFDDMMGAFEQIFNSDGTIKHQSALDTKTSHL